MNTHPEAMAKTKSPSGHFRLIWPWVTTAVILCHTFAGVVPHHHPEQKQETASYHCTNLPEGAATQHFHQDKASSQESGPCLACLANSPSLVGPLAITAGGTTSFYQKSPLPTTAWCRSSEKGIPTLRGPPLRT